MMTSRSPTAAETTQTSPAVALEHVSRLYGSFVALRDVSLTLPAGSSVVLLGPNGAGKSTLLKVIAGLHRPNYGQVRLFGQPPEALRGRVAYMSHSTMLYDELTGPENLEYMLGLERPALTSADRRRVAVNALEQVGLRPDNPRRVGEYSQGMRQRAALARVLLTDPDLLLLDEPFSNLDTASADAMIARLQQHLLTPSRHGVAHTLVLTTHQAELARPLAGTTLLLRDGRLVAADQPQIAAAAPPIAPPPAVAP